MQTKHLHASALKHERAHGKPQLFPLTGSYAQIPAAHQLREAWRIRKDKRDNATHIEHGRRYATARQHFDGGRTRKPRPVTSVGRYIAILNTPGDQFGAWNFYEAIAKNPSGKIRR
jgi:hypothetical protein